MNVLKNGFNKEARSWIGIVLSCTCLALEWLRSSTNSRLQEVELAYKALEEAVRR